LAAVARNSRGSSVAEPNDNSHLHPEATVGTPNTPPDRIRSVAPGTPCRREELRRAEGDGIHVPPGRMRGETGVNQA
jgi:hypothetical protein